MIHQYVVYEYIMRNLYIVQAYAPVAMPAGGRAVRCRQAGEHHLAGHASTTGRRRKRKKIESISIQKPNFPRNIQKENLV